MTDELAIIKQLLEAAEAYVPRARAPYSGKPDAVVLLLSDGTWVPGVRVESASFSLSIPALLNAVTTAVALGRRDIVAIVTTGLPTPADEAFLKGLPAGPWRRTEGGWIMGSDPLPEPRICIDPFHSSVGAVVQQSLAAVREVAALAWTPESDFPVGCLLVAEDGRAVPGVNVEHRDWSSILCAERNAVGTAVTFGVTELHSLFLSCLKDSSGTPCGACRQVLAEHVPEVAIWMDRGDAEPERSTPDALLPFAFSGEILAR